MPGAGYALRVIHPGSPVLRVRYRNGILVDPHGFPDWLLYARAVVDLPPPVPGLTRDEVRVVDVLCANECMVVNDDPLWDFTRDDYVARTPPGWTWAHLGTSRQVALVPIELHGSYRHAGGVRAIDAPGRGLRRDDEPVPVVMDAHESVPEQALTAVEAHLGYGLPPVYRSFLAATNGGFPVGPGVLAGYGFVADQPFFGLARDDRHQELWYADAWTRDRLTGDFLAIGYVQGGLLAVKVRGDDLDSVWYLDDDDPRDDDAYDAAYLCAHLMHRVADDVDAFWAALHSPAWALLSVVDDLVEADRVMEARPKLAGAGLPDGKRAPWQPPPRKVDDPLVRLAEQG
jgi:hypothetical protein